MLLHGGPGLWDHLEPVASMLAPDALVHRFDQRGCGCSEDSSEQTIGRYLADIESLRTHWGHRQWVVIGHSFGASLAPTYAVAHPERIAGLGYLSGVGVGDWRTPYRAERRRRMTPEQEDRLAQLDARRRRSRAEEVEYRTLAWFIDHADPVAGWDIARTEAESEHAINAVANRALVAQSDEWSEEQVRAWVSALTVPSVFIHGAADPRPSETVAALAEESTLAQFHLVPGSGHQIWHERCGELAVLLRELIRNVNFGTA